MTADVLIVHAVDAEGPLHESLDATFGRLAELYGLDNLPRTRDTIERLKGKEIPLDGLEDRVAETLNGHLLDYNDTWDKIDAMVDRLLSREVRFGLTDSYGGGWVFNWHCLDHVGYENNPRRRALGHHAIFDHYRDILTRNPDVPDAIHWHFHPMSTYRDAHRCATHYLRSDEIYQVLCRKVIERDWFPAVFRAGFQAERPDCNWFLEQFIPFDISNMAEDDYTELDRNLDFKNGRSGDWRGAPADWSIYHPDHDDHQRPGQCRRWIGRALNVLNRVAPIDQREMDKAFARAEGGAPTLVGFASHDFRDLGREVEFLQSLIGESAARHPDVKFRFCEGRDGFRRAIWPDGFDGEALDLELVFHPSAGGDVPFIEIETSRGQVFGPQPFLAIETRSGRFIHDNLDFSPCRRKWFYAFHGDTLPIEDVGTIAVAANDRFGNTCIRKFNAAAEGETTT